MLTWAGGDAPARTLRASTARRAFAGIGLALLLVVGTTVPAAAARRAGPGASCPPDQPDCSVWDDEPGNPGGGGDNGGGDDDDGGGGGGGVCRWEGRTVPCYDDLKGWFNSGDGCYYELAEPQREAPEGQHWYVRTCNGGDDIGNITVVLREEPPGFGAPPNPEELARRALATITLKPAPLAVAPRKDNGPGLVGLPVWMWSDKRADYFGPIPARATDRGVTVTITAAVDRIVWDMGNGDHVTCAGAGTPYDATDDNLAGRTSPTCGYHKGYQKADTYDVTATTHWKVTWNGGGESGEILVTRNSGIVRIQINELQVVTR
ncbi:hypothetical protein ACLQ29_07800 [Micromonospora sp. DT228]|uniref:hypothetical protein n=1 Tax=Micromonospora sp. DT228 TaxID=3393443 RepID=UPI003CF24F15